MGVIAGCGLDEETFHPPVGEGPWVLVDLYHSRLQNHEDYRMTKGDYHYQGVFGYYRAFEHLADNGYKIASIREMPLSLPRLEGFDVLFINLVDESRPAFSAEEYAAIDQWVKQGGGLFVIVDHTNVYRSSERINPLLKPMGIEVGYHTVVEFSPEYAITGKAWLMLWDFYPHYVTGGVEMISPQTGGPLFGSHGIAFSSPQSLADYWDVSDEGGYYGNMIFDGDPELEPSGPLAMVAAREYGEGRVVVVGDQNIFGDAWLHFANNFDLMMNAFQWVAHQEDKAPLRDARPAGFNIGLDMGHNDFNLGRTYDEGYYPFFVNLNRDHQVSARARLHIHPQDDALLLMNPNRLYDTADLSRIRTYFRQGKSVVLSFEADRLNPATAALLGELAPDFSLDITTRTGTHKRVTFLPADEFRPSNDIAQLPGHHPLVSDTVAVDELSLASRPRWGSALPAYLLDITSDWGEPLVRARVQPAQPAEPGAPRLVDIARRKQVDKGELIVIIQDAYFRNRTLGRSEVNPPEEPYRDAVEFQYRLMDYLKERARLNSAPKP